MRKNIASSAVNSTSEDNNKRKKSLIKFGILAFLAFIVWIFSTIAWFAMNTSVGVSGMGVSTVALPFNIATSGTQVRNKSILEAMRTNYSEGNTYGVYKTSQDTDYLMLRFTPNVDDPETEEDESEVLDIGPDSCGELSLYVIPKNSDDIDAYIDLDIISFKSVTVNDSEVLIEINDDLTTNPNLTSAQINDCKQAAEYLKGHIMFFQGLSSNPSQYSYVTPVIDGKIHFHQENAIAGTAYRIPIYWTWPNTLGQIALKTGTLREGTPVVQETSEMGTSSNPTDKALVLKYLTDNKDIVFKDLNAVTTIKNDLIESLSVEQKSEYDALETDEEKEEYLEEYAEIDDCIENAINNADTRKYFDFLSDGYNSADISIGTNLNYFIIEVTVKSTE